MPWLGSEPNGETTERAWTLTFSSADTGASEASVAMISKREWETAGETEWDREILAQGTSNGGSLASALGAITVGGNQTLDDIYAVATAQISSYWTNTIAPTLNT